MKKTLAILVALGALSTDAVAGAYVLRSSTTGAIAAPVVVTPPVLPDPSAPYGFKLSIAGPTSIVAGGVLDLRPVVVGAVGPVSFSWIGLPLGANFRDATGTGRIGGFAFVPGTYQVVVIATDSTDTSVLARIVLVVT